MHPTDQMTLALVQMRSALEPVENIRRACDYVDEAASAAQKPDLVVLPEFFNTLYVFQYRDYKYIDYAERDTGPAISRMREKAVQHRIHIIATIFELDQAGICYDTAMVIDPEGTIVGKYRKVHPAAVNSLEKIYFRFGSYFPVFKVGDWRVGINICYDTFFPESARCAAVNGAELIVVPFAAPTVSVNRWRETMVTRAYENGVYFAPCNKVGKEGDFVFGGDSMIVDPSGEVIAEAGQKADRIISARIDRGAVFAARRARPMFRDRRPDLYGPICTPTEDIPRVD